MIIVGAGGHGQVVADILLKSAASGVVVLGFVDDNSATHGASLLGLPAMGAVRDLQQIEHDGVIVAIGDNRQRQELASHLKQSGERLVACVHPSAQIGFDVQIGAGSMICAGAVINTGSRLGECVIVNTGATVDHHTMVGDFAHIAPGVHMGAEVRVGTTALVGIGAVVLPRIHVGCGATVGGGAVVIEDVDEGGCVVGVPAKPLAMRNR